MVARLSYNVALSLLFFSWLFASRFQSHNRKTGFWKKEEGGTFLAWLVGAVRHGWNGKRGRKKKKKKKKMKDWRLKEDSMGGNRDAGGEGEKSEKGIIGDKLEGIIKQGAQSGRDCPILEAFFNVINLLFVITMFKKNNAHHGIESNS